MSQEPREPNLSTFSGGNPHQPEHPVQLPSPTSDAISQWLLSKLAEELQIDPEEIDIHEPFTSYGISSVLAVSLSGDLEDWLGRPLSPTLVFDFPTIEALAKHLSGEFEEYQPGMKSEKQFAFNEPIAVIGMACRVPGAEDLSSFWNLLREGRDAITEVPPERWDAEAYYHPDPAAPGKMNTRWGGFLQDIDLFDASFFGISPREAARMDPQQRLLLEIAWEALEDAGQTLEHLKGSRTGVFIGLSTHDYQRIQLEAGDSAHDDPYSGTGVASSIASGRLSYCLGFQGPNLSVDTACSSSLTALHLACQSLKLGECDQALVGGVNLVLTPEGNIYFTKMRAMASDGRCKVFDSSADGYVRGEGCAVVVLKRLSEAIEDADNIRAVIRGSALAHDGRSSGLTVPNGQSQQSVIRQALEAAGVHPTEVSCIEAHGTGTALGDPIELQALAGVFGNDRESYQPLQVGSVKTNIGHLEAAAGIVGLIKVILSLEQEEIPPHLHFRNPTPHVDWNSIPFEIPVSRRPWKQGDRKRIAGVSSFGFSGTNVHVIIEEAPLVQSRKSGRGGYSPKAPRLILPLSARSQPALRAACSSLSHLLRSRPQASRIWLRDVCYSAAVRKTHHEHRVVISGDSREELLEGLDRLAAGNEVTANAFRGRKPIHSQPKAGFQFGEPVQGWNICCGSLLDEFPSFRGSVEECERVCREIADHSILHEMNTPSGVARIDSGTSSPCAYAAFQIGLARLLQSCGITPQVITGQGTGLLAAACLAGSLDLPNLFRILLAGQAGVSEATISLTPANIPLLLPGQSWVKPGEIPDGLLTALQYTGAGVASEKDPAIEALDVLVDVGPFSFSQGMSSATSPLRITVPRSEITSWETDHLYRFAALLFSQGFELQWKGLFPDGGRFVKLPSYPWQRERFWIEKTGLGVDHSKGLNHAQQDTWKDWLYQPGWVELPATEKEPSPRGKCTWLLFSDEGGVGKAIGNQIEKIGDSVIHVFRKPQLGQLPANSHTLLDPDKNNLDHLFQSVRSQRIEKVVYAWSLDSGTDAGISSTLTTDAMADSCSTFALMLQSLVGNSGESNPKLWVLTCNAQSAPGRNTTIDFSAAPLIGFCTSVAAEHSTLWGGMIDMDPHEELSKVSNLVVHHIRNGLPEDRVAFSGGKGYAERLLPFDPDNLPPSPPLRTDAAYLITGGFGELGLEVARHLVKQGTRRLILLGRTALPPRNRWNSENPSNRMGKIIATIRELEHQGASVHTAQVDLSSPDGFSTFIESYREEAWPPIRGIIHAAGHAIPGSALDFNQEDFRAMLSAKAGALSVICKQFKSKDLDFILLFSSASSILESPFLGGYAAANSYLDQAAHQLRGGGYPVLSINWGFWNEIGMAVRFREESGRDHLSKGMQGIPTVEGMQIFDRMRGLREPQLAVLPIEWASWAEAHPSIASKPLFNAIWKSRAIDKRTAPGLLEKEKNLALLSHLAGLPETEKESVLLAAVLEQAAQVLDIESERIDPDDPLDQMGIDSLMAVELRNWVEVQLGIVIPMADLLKGPTVRSITLSLLQEISRAPHIIEPAKNLSQGDTDNITSLSPEAILGCVDQLTEDQIDHLLHNLLSEDKGGR